MKEYRAQLKRYAPKANPDEPLNVYGWAVASTMVKALEEAGDDLDRQKIMDVVRNLDVEIPTLLPGIKVQTGEDDGYPIQSMQIMRFQGENWKLEGEVVSAKG